MIKQYRIALLIINLLTGMSFSTSSKTSENEIKILVNQVAYNQKGTKQAMIKSEQSLPDGLGFQLINVGTGIPAYSGKIRAGQRVESWGNEYYSPINFSDFYKNGTYKIRIILKEQTIDSYQFQIGDGSVSRIAIPAIVNFFYHQRANSPEELAADRSIRLHGSTRTVNLTGGWCDASGDVSKYFSHLAYTNVMLPQQIPMVTWSMVNTVETIPAVLENIGSKQSLASEAIYGADYLMRSLDADGYFYMTVFSYFDKNPSARRVVGLLADSKTTDDYQCAFREGGGMAIAALARISQWKMNGDFSAAA